MNIDQLRNILQLAKQENEWVEFKTNNENPEQIGEYLSALSNSAALHNQPKAYLIYGIDDNMNIVGTKFKPKTAKKGNELLENWLHQRLDGTDFDIYEIEHDNKIISAFEIDPAQHKPVSFGQKEYIRIGSSKRFLGEYPDKEKKLWQKFSSFCFEEDIAMHNISASKILELLDYKSFFDLMNIPYSTAEVNIVSKLTEYKLVCNHNDGNYDITNLGALLFANNMDEFKDLSNSRIRVIKYSGSGKLNAETEHIGVKGYAVGFKGLIRYIMNLLPRKEVIKNGIREDATLYPEIAIRELIANALIHQDLTIRGTSPMIEIFDDRIEITNSGEPLIDILRLMDYQPKSRNEKLARLMRQMGICEERGSGIDKVIAYIEIYQLPAPKFIAETNHFKVIVFAPLKFQDMDKQDRIRATYQHCCLKYLTNNSMTNATLRKRFGIQEKHASKASKIIVDTLEGNFIKSANPENKSPKHNKYIPFWA